jgi:carboxyl-terminal processing protease
MNQSKKLTVLIVFLVGFIFGISFLTVSKFFVFNSSVYAQTLSTNSTEIPDPEDDNYFKYFPMFREAYNVIKREFYNKDEVTAKKLIYGAIKGMLENLEDPYTTFMDPSISKEFNIEMAGSFGGLGIQIDIRDSWLTVVSPIEDTPAWRAGIKPGDKIIEIDDITTKGISVKEAMNKLRGKPGTKVTITIVRESINEPFKVPLKREEIKLKTVKSDVIKKGNKTYGYVKMLEFSMPTGEEFKTQLKGVLDKQIDGLIVDLRNNPGGLLNVVVNCADDFLDEGLIVYTRGRQPENNADYTAALENTFVSKDLPMVVMINQGSASASEIFAGAMQDSGRAVLVGMKSFGKGSVQKTYPFQDDGSQIKFTVAKYFTPAGRSIDKKGLSPDVEEKMWYDMINDEEKNALVKIQTTNFIKEFLAQSPNYDEAKVLEFQKSLQERGYKVGKKSLEWMIKMKKSESSLPVVYDSEFDNQLTKALDVLDNYPQYKKPFKVYKEAK